ncbi:MAG: DsbA family oxidoreductase [Acidimicrobiia bacterium]
MGRAIAVAFDYRCPFARNAHEAVVALIRRGSPIEWHFLAFSLDQSHVEPGDPPVWERPDNPEWTGLQSALWGIAVRDQFPDSFLDFHLAAFAARHDHGQRIQDAAVMRNVASGVGLDPGAVAAVIASGEPLATLADEHQYCASLGVFGVPAFIENDDAAFIRFMERGRVDDLELALAVLANPRINELKHAQVPR